MRKFRAWDKNNEEMVKVIKISYKYYSDGIKFITVQYKNNETLTEYADSFELMQYTGLKDKNDKEIYEGDIVKGEVGFQGKVMKVKGQVKYTHCRFVIAEWNCSLFQFSNDFAGGGFWIEKIGNKYENPELLEADDHD